MGVKESQVDFIQVSIPSTSRICLLCLGYFYKKGSQSLKKPKLTSRLIFQELIAEIMQENSSFLCLFRDNYNALSLEVTELITKNIWPCFSNVEKEILEQATTN